MKRAAPLVLPALQARLWSQRLKRRRRGAPREYHLTGDQSSWTHAFHGLFVHPNWKSTVFLGTLWPYGPVDLNHGQVSVLGFGTGENHHRKTIKKTFCDTWSESGLFAQALFSCVAQPFLSLAVEHHFVVPTWNLGSACWTPGYKD